VFEVGEDGKLSNKRLFHDFKDNKPGFADGLRVDVEGNLWCGTGWAGDGFDGVHVFAPDGTLLGQILLPEICANVAFGGDKRSRLFMAASSSLYVLNVNTRGAAIC
jgi:gluconolactonase